MNKKLNRLAHESSPYLRQHAGNPVDWYPWGAEALEKAKKEDKPIFLSVGYSSCHWCHVMEHESFERDDVAGIMNAHFINIKVDREEHPDLDALYMTATQLVTQRGGWPNSVWLTPDGRPWYAGTYFPREDRQGRIGFKSMLLKLADIWRDRRNDVEEQARTLTEAIAQQQTRKKEASGGAGAIGDIHRHIQQQFINQFDARFGGFGDAPKFPPHSGLLLLLRTRTSSPDRQTDIVIERTLEAMLRGGIYDQIGGGFHRYTTDEHWLLPHFEKMLYDNALLLEVFARAATAFDRPSYRRIVQETAAWLFREMSHPDGGFYSALDADSEREEGKYYTWSYEEISRVLGDDASRAFAGCYRILPGGNFSDEATGHPTGLNIPHLDEAASEEIIAGQSGSRATLLQQRMQRVPPGLDNKVIAGWNGLMIRALVVAARLLDLPELLDKALKARSFIEYRMIDGNRLARSWCDGSISPREGVLEDYAALALADLDLFFTTGDQQHLGWARRSVQIIVDHFLDAENDEIFMTSDRNSTLLMRMKDIFDQGSPSGLGLAVQAIARFGAVSSDVTLIDLARRLAHRQGIAIQRMPSAVSALTEGLLLADDMDAFMAWELVIRDDGLRIVGLLPEGWYLNDVTFHREEDLAPVDFPMVQPHQWSIPPSTRSSGKFTSIMVSFQPCSPTECRPERQVRVLLPPLSQCTL